MAVQPAPPIEIDLEGEEIVIRIKHPAWGLQAGSVTPERAEELADQLRGIAQYVRTMKGT